MRLKEVEGQIGTKGGRVKRRIKIERGQKEKKKKKGGRGGNEGRKA